MGIAYFDGAHPSIIMSRGVYAYPSRASVGTTGRRPVQVVGLGQRRQRAIRRAGKILWDQKLIKGHGDFVHIGVLNPARSGLQIFRILEAAQDNGVAMLDAATGTVLWGKTIAGDASRGYASHIDSRQKGAQCWAGQINDDLLNYDGSVICNGTSPSKGRPLGPHMVGRRFDSFDNRDEFSGNDGVHINRWNGASCSLTELMKTGSGTRITQTIADILGDWREELVIALPNEVRVYTTTIPASNRPLHAYATITLPAERGTIGSAQFWALLFLITISARHEYASGARHQVRRPAPLDRGYCWNLSGSNGPGGRTHETGRPYLAAC